MVLCISEFTGSLLTPTPTYTPLETNEVIYKIDCNNCDAVYIDETSKTVEEVHHSCVRRKYENSLIFKHEEDFRHSFNFENTKILQQSKQLGTRRDLEYFYSYANSNSINTYL